MVLLDLELRLAVPAPPPLQGNPRMLAGDAQNWMRSGVTRQSTKTGCTANNRAAWDNVDSDLGGPPCTCYPRKHDRGGEDTPRTVPPQAASYQPSYGALSINLLHNYVCAV
jgi:hypothetical protein